VAAVELVVAGVHVVVRGETARDGLVLEARVAIHPQHVELAAVTHGEQVLIAVAVEVAGAHAVGRLVAQAVVQRLEVEPAVFERRECVQAGGLGHVVELAIPAAVVQAVLLRGAQVAELPVTIAHPDVQETIAVEVEQGGARGGERVGAAGLQGAGAGEGEHTGPSLSSAAVRWPVSLEASVLTALTMSVSPSLSRSP
jgi:hypothetical protein